MHHATGPSGALPYRAFSCQLGAPPGKLRAMDFKLSPEEKAFRDELRAWLEAHAPRDWARLRPTLDTEARAQFLIDWQRRLHAAGYVELHWPVAYGGRGATVKARVDSTLTAPTGSMERRLRE